jgi:hypothetical protein
MGSRTSNRPETARFISAKGALFLAAAAAFAIASEGSAEQTPDEVHVQGGWAYTTTVKGAAVEHVAATRAAEAAVWFLLACSADGRLPASHTSWEWNNDDDEIRVGRPKPGGSIGK